jgi:hypothetical protein
MNETSVKIRQTLDYYYDKNAKPTWHFSKFSLSCSRLVFRCCRTLGSDNDAIAHHIISHTITLQYSQRSQHSFSGFYGSFRNSLAMLSYANIQAEQRNALNIDVEEGSPFID